MADLLKAASIASKMEESRATLRKLWGPKYDAVIEPYRDEIRKIAKAKKIGALDALLLLKREGITDSWGGMMLACMIAATADLVEGEG